MILQRIGRGAPDPAGGQRCCDFRSVSRLLVQGVYGAVAVFLLYGSTARSALIVTTSAPPAAPLEVLPEQVTAPLLLSVLDDGNPPQPESEISGWQFTLMIAPDAGSGGTLKFESAELPAGNYVLGTTSINFGLTTIPTPVAAATDTLTAFDFRVTGSAVVPGEPGAGALLLEFFASADARGTFGLFAVGGLGFTEWSDDQQPPNAREFANIPSMGVTRIADVRVAPEPTSLHACLLAATVATLLLRLRWRETIPAGTDAG
jgi:hypothetical protein